MAKQSAFQIFNQKLKEKIGVAEQVTTYPEEPELSTKLEILTNQIKKITREIHKQEKTTTTLLEAGTELSDSLVDGGVSFREDPLRYMLAGGLDKVAEVQRHVDDLRSKLGKQIVSEVYEPLDNVIEVDVKEAKMQKSKFEKTRVELDAGISKLNGLGKKAKEEKIKEVS
jgi:argininosuccinate lyase